MPGRPGTILEPAPLQTVPGQPMQISWTITNQGNATATGPWTDTLYLSDDSVIGNDQPLTNFTYSVAYFYEK